MKFKYGIFILFFSINCFAHHPGNQIDADKPYPSINLKVIKDKIDGYNIFINDIRITRIYSDWVHVPQRFFNLKENFIKITIHSYLHDQFTIKGKPIEHIVKVNDN